MFKFENNVHNFLYIFFHSYTLFEVKIKIDKNYDSYCNCKIYSATAKKKLKYNVQS